MQRGHDVDVAIVGGGPAGISTALHLHAASPHLRVVVLEKARYPREKICAGGIGARAFRILEALGAAVDCPCVPLDAVAMRVGGQTVVVRVPDCGAVVRRIEFDHAFANLAVARGIDVRDGHAVQALRVDEHGVTIDIARAGHDDLAARVDRDAGDPEIAVSRPDPDIASTIRARVVVGADGVAGIVRRATGFPRGELRAQVVELDTEDTAFDLPRDTVVFDFSTTELRGYAWDFPTTVGGIAQVCRGVYVLHDGAATGKAHAAGEPRARLTTYLAERGLDIARYRLKQFAERGWKPGVEIAAPRVLLVGEAAGIDIATGEGIGQAIEYGSIAGPYLAEALARDDVGFADWRRTVEDHHLGFQLSIRHLCYRAFYGRRRPTIERLMPRLTELFRVGVQDFAGVPLSKLAIVHGAGQFLAAYARAKLA